VGDFDEVSLSGAFSARIEVGKGRRVRLTGDDNLLPLVVMKVKDSRLVVGTREQVRPSLDLTLDISTPALRGLRCSGASKAVILGVSGERFTLDLSGAGKVQLEGKVKEAVLDLSGASEVEAERLLAEDVRIKASGAASVEVFASKSLDVDLSGAGKVIYSGNPARVTRDISGVGKVEKK
jgi:hypothetical protein